MTLAMEIRTEAGYSDTLRFQLWRAAVDDSVALGMSYRVYHTHIHATLTYSRSKGTRIVSASGEPLVFRNLYQDDLWGFLGKGGNERIGPQRRISDPKIAVLDAYFKVKYPILAASFGKTNISFEFSSILKLFFASTEDFLIKNDAELDKINGLYLSKARVKSSPELKRGKPTLFTASAFIVRRRPYNDYIALHKISIPLTVKDLADSVLNEEVRRKIPQYAPEQTSIFSGVAIPCAADDLRSFQLSCLLKDSVTEQPHLTQLDIVMKDFGPDENDLSNPDESGYLPLVAHEVVGGTYVKSHRYCTMTELYANDLRSLGYSDTFLSKVVQLYETLGAEA